jgi:hypothetical protein
MPEAAENPARNLLAIEQKRAEEAISGAVNGRIGIEP